MADEVCFCAMCTIQTAKSLISYMSTSPSPLLTPHRATLMDRGFYESPNILTNLQVFADLPEPGKRLSSYYTFPSSPVKTTYTLMQQ